MWMSDLIAKKLQRQAEGPVRRGHLMVFEGGKMVEGCNVGQKACWQQIYSWFVRNKKPLVLRKITTGK